MACDRLWWFDCLTTEARSSDWGVWERRENGNAKRRCEKRESIKVVAPEAASPCSWSCCVVDGVMWGSCTGMLVMEERAQGVTWRRRLLFGTCAEQDLQIMVLEAVFNLTPMTVSASYFARLQP